MHYIASAPHALHILIFAHIYAYTGSSRGAEIRNSSGASAKGGRWSTSAKCEDTNIAFGSRKAPFIPPTIFGFSLITIFMLCLIAH
jgi:hypothetical protein